MSSRDSERYATLCVVVLSSFLAPFMASSLNVALPAIGAEFALNAVVLGWVVTSYILASAVFLLPCGRLADIHGRKKTFVWGMVVYTLGASLSAAAPSEAALIFGRVVNGAGAAMGFATGTAILISVVSPQERGRALGWNVAAVYLGLSLGPFLGGIIAHDLGWRWIFILNAVAGLFATGLALWKLKGEWAEARGESFDLVGSVIYAAALVALIYGCSMLPRPRGAALVLVSGAGFFAFARWEMAAASPVFDLKVFRGNSVFLLSNVAALINYSATAAVGFLLSLYLQYSKGLTPREAGLVLVAQPLVMTLCSPLAGRLSDRIPAGSLASFGMAVTTAALAVFCFLGKDTALWFVVAGLGVLGFGFGLFSSPNTNAVMSSVDRKRYGIASSTLATMRMLGQTLSMTVVMLIVALIVGRVQLGPENQHLFLKCMRLAFAVFAALCLLGVFASMARGKPAAVSPQKL